MPYSGRCFSSARMARLRSRWYLPQKKSGVSGVSGVSCVFVSGVSGVEWSEWSELCVFCE